MRVGSNMRSYKRKGVASKKRRIIIRRATLKDAPQLAKVYNDAFGPTNTQDVRRWMSRKDYRRETIVAVVGGVVASAVSILYLNLMIAGTLMKTGGVAAVATRWDYRRQGLSTRLLREANRTIKAKGISNATLYTSFSLPAIRVYRRVGYKEVMKRTQITAIYNPVEELKRAFKDRSRWFTRTPYTRTVIKNWKERVLIESDGWRATISSDGKKFVVQKGRKGKPTIVVRSGTIPFFEGFWNRITYDQHMKEGKVQITGAPEACVLWRRIVVMEWME